MSDDTICRGCGRELDPDMSQAGLMVCAECGMTNDLPGEYSNLLKVIERRGEYRIIQRLPDGDRHVHPNLAPFYIVRGHPYSGTHIDYANVADAVSELTELLSREVPISPPTPKPVKAHLWELGEAIELARNLECICVEHGFHVAIGGSVLYRGWSDKDLDIHIYKHYYKDRENEAPLATQDKQHLMGVLATKEPFDKFIDAGSDEYPDEGDSGRDIYYCYLNDGRRIDFFFFQ